MHGWMHGVVLIRCIDRWMVLICSFSVPARWVATLFFRAFFWYPLEHSFSHFWFPPGPPADPKMRSKTPKVGLRRHFFSHIRFHHEIWCFFACFMIWINSGPEAHPSHPTVVSVRTIYQNLSKNPTSYTNFYKAKRLKIWIRILWNDARYLYLTTLAGGRGPGPSPLKLAFPAHFPLSLSHAHGCCKCCPPSMPEQSRNDPHISEHCPWTTPAQQQQTQQ